jgi:DNA topoisomerase-2
MLAKLLKDYEILFNKVKFIQAVITGTIKINKVKRQQIMLKCKEIGLKTMVELNAIMDPFIKDKKKQARIVSNQEAGSGDEAQVEETKENEIPVNHYDYLLSMPLWSLTEERVIDLENQMHRKKEEHDTLQKRTIF